MLVYIYSFYKIYNYLYLSHTAQEIDYGMLDRMNDEFELLNRAIVNLEWQTFKNRSNVPLEVYLQFVQLKLNRRNGWCAKLMDLRDNGVSVNPKLLRFLCKGSKYTNEMTRYDEKVLTIKIPFLI